MANTVANVFVQTFERNVRFLAQQKGSRLLAWCQKKTEQSTKHNFERVGKLTADDQGGPRGRVARQRHAVRPARRDARPPSTSATWSSRKTSSRCSSTR
jgi:hypothetical protein